MSEAIVGKIKIGTKTEGHKALLEAKGYKVQELDGYLYIQCEGFHTDIVDLTTEAGQAVAKEVISDHKLFTYKTPFNIPEKGMKSGIFAVGSIGKLSAFVATDAAAKAKKSSVSDEMQNAIDNIL